MSVCHHERKMRFVRSRRIIRIGFTVCTLGLLLFAQSGHHNQRQAELQSLSYGHYTAQQALKRSVSIFQALFLHRDAYSVALERSAIWLHNGQHIRLWSIECTDRQNRYLGSLYLDAETGQIVKLDSTPPQTYNPASSPVRVSKRCAMATAHSWLNVLAPRECWRATGVTDSSLSVWHFLYASSRYQARVAVDSDRATLISVQIQPTAGDKADVVTAVK